MKRLALALLPALSMAAEPTLPVAPNLRTEGIPPIPMALVEKLARYNESRTATFSDWHPARREMLISTRFGDVLQVHRVNHPGGARTQLTFFPDRVSGARSNPKTGDSFVFMKDNGGGEFYQIYLCDTRSGEITLLTDGKSRNNDSHWSPDGKLLVYSSTRRNGRDTDIYLVNPEDPASTRMLLQVEGGGWGADDWSPDERSVLVSHYRSVHQSELYLVDASSGQKQLLTPSGERASYADAHFAPDGKSLYLTTDRDSEFRRLAVMDLATRKLTFLRPDLQWDVEDLAISKNGRRLAYVVNEAGAGALHVMDLASQRDLPLPKIPAGTMGAAHWHSNNRDLAFSLSSSRSPSDVYSIDVENSALDRWTESETGGLNAKNFVEPELIRWKSFDGRMISGFLYRPPAQFTGPRPVIVNIHGGPEGQSRPGYLARNNYYLNELGVAIIYPNVRGSSGYGKTFLALDNGVKREDSVKDIGALLDWIAADKGLDAQRIMVTGGSYGGYMTLASMTNFNDRFRCAVDVVGISNFLTFFERTEAYRRDLRRVEYGDEREPAMREFFLKIAPINNVSKVTKPMMIVAGRNDPRVPAREGEQMAAAMRKNGVPVWFLLAEDEGHGFSKKKNQDFQFAATVQFVRQFLLN